MRITLQVVTKIVIAERKKTLRGMNWGHTYYFVKVSRPARCVIITAGGRSDSPAAASTILGRTPRVCCRARFANYVHRARSRTAASSRQSSARSGSCSNGKRHPANCSVSGIGSTSRVETAGGRQRLASEATLRLAISAVAAMVKTSKWRNARIDKDIPLSFVARHCGR